MNFCVIKNTTTVIDGSENPIEIMIQNAENAGFSVEQVEILTEVEYTARKALEPIPPKPPTEQEQIDALKQDKLDLSEIVLDLLMWKLESEV